MFRIGALLRRRRGHGYPPELPDRIVEALGKRHVTHRELRRHLFGLEKLSPDEADWLTRALRDLEASGKIRRFGRGHGANFYELTFYANVGPDVEAW